MTKRIKPGDEGWNPKLLALAKRLGDAYRADKELEEAREAASEREQAADAARHLRDTMRHG